MKYITKDEVRNLTGLTEVEVNDSQLERIIDDAENLVVETVYSASEHAHEPIETQESENNERKAGHQPQLKLYRRVPKQHYSKKGFYEYEQIMVPIPKEFHEFAKPFLGRELEILIKLLPPAQEGVEIILKPKKASGPP